MSRWNGNEAARSQGQGLELLRDDGPCRRYPSLFGLTTFSSGKHTQTDMVNKITGFFPLHGDSYVISKVTKTSEWTQILLFI